MYITWHGLTSFKIQTQDCTLITDPFGKETGLKPVRSQAEIVTIGQSKNPDGNYTSGISGNPYIITGPGEYELKRVFVHGLADQLAGQPLKPDFLTLYYFEVEGIQIAHLGTINHPLTNEQLETFEVIDVLLIPVGGKPALSPNNATENISKIQPPIVIPMYYRLPGFKPRLDTLNGFLQEMGIKSPEEMPKLKLVKRDLPQEETRTIILQP